MGASAWFETVTSRRVHDGYSRVRIDTVRTPDGELVEREIVEHDDAVAVVPLTDGEEVLLLRQYRHALGRDLLEVPAGTLDVAGEEVRTAARRELLEEMHVTVRELEPLTVFVNSAGWATEQTHIYLGRGVEVSSPPDGFTPKAEEAHLEVVTLPLAVAVEAVADGTITDAKTAIGLL
ncbi:MAG: NUDIX domain-containing protein, partial [Actinomycetota bacterium]